MLSDEVREHTRSNSDSASCIVGQLAMTHAHARYCHTHSAGEKWFQVRVLSLQQQPDKTLILIYDFGFGERRRAAGALYDRDEREREGGKSCHIRCTKQLAACASYSGITRPRQSSRAQLLPPPLVGEEKRVAKPK